jgi:excisionase family DNA binding protein
MSAELSDFIRQMDRGREITSDDMPELALLIANELAALARLSGSIVASVLRRPGSPIASPEALTTKDGVNSFRDRVAFRVRECANMLGVSNSALYEMINRREIGIIRLGDKRAIRIPKKEIERFLRETFVPPTISRR